jgi:hypothetical protein
MLAFVLVFWNPKAFRIGQMIWSMDLRKVLLPDEKGSKDPSAVRLRKKGISIVAVWEFDLVKDEAYWWMDEEVMKICKREDWNVQIWRVDTYTPVSTPLLVKQAPRGSVVDGGLMSTFPTNGLTEREYWFT